MARLSLEERREAAIAATLRVIAADGVEAATTRRIATEANMGQSSIFYAFASRDELLAAVVEHGVAQELDSMNEWLETLADAPVGDTPMEDLVRAGLLAFAENAITEPARQQVLIGLALYARRTPGLEYLAERLYDGYYDVAARVLDESARIGGRSWSQPTAELAPTVIALSDGITLCWLGTGSRERVNAVVESAVTLILGYLR
ncbi:TetR family transcriptional regulator [Gordonia sp. HY285]|uniref:TetR family transcriptional regulator n=1 Tax=Gordonia liuliyuniae TaxID=2911517 RepID=A0ABS9IWE1_9ACTN|nr:TetR family transcriptional regulator [Gordonia liuliyuniae]MCF8589880.1 TetR family transcriptional regulator [Gordonia liuliyuniae]MCF8612175.1 TetR family transcriptional regulator [Gordonia liuliyuniae]